VHAVVSDAADLNAAAIIVVMFLVILYNIFVAVNVAHFVSLPRWQKRVFYAVAITTMLTAKYVVKRDVM
jgi:hypothetical protein